MSDNLSTLPFLCCYSVCHAWLLNTDASYHYYYYYYYHHHHHYY